MEWIGVKPFGIEDIPPFALMQTFGIDATTGNINVQKPTVDNSREVMVNGEASIPHDVDNSFGKGTFDIIVTVAYDSADGTPAVGDEWGCKSGSWYLKKGYKGFRVISLPDTETEVVNCLRIGYGPYRQGFWARLTTNSGRRWNYIPVSMFAGSGSNLPAAVGTETTGYPAFENPYWSDGTISTNNLWSSPVANQIVWMYYPAPDSIYPEFEPTGYASPAQVGIVNLVAQGFSGAKTFYHSGFSSAYTLIDGGTFSVVSSGISTVITGGNLTSDKTGTFKESLIVASVPNTGSGFYNSQAVVYTVLAGGGLVQTFNVRSGNFSGSLYREVDVFLDALLATDTTTFGNATGTLSVGGSLFMEGGIDQRAFPGQDFTVTAYDTTAGSITLTSTKITLKPARWSNLGIGTPATYLGAYIQIYTDGTLGPSGPPSVLMRHYYYNGNLYFGISGAGYPVSVTGSPKIVAPGGFALGMGTGEGATGTDPVGNVFSGGIILTVGTGGGGGPGFGGSLT